MNWGLSQEVESGDGLDSTDITVDLAEGEDASPDAKLVKAARKAAAVLADAVGGTVLVTVGGHESPMGDFAVRNVSVTVSSVNVEARAAAQAQLEEQFNAASEQLVAGILEGAVEPGPAAPDQAGATLVERCRAMAALAAGELAALPEDDWRRPAFAAQEDAWARRADQLEADLAASEADASAQGGELEGES